MRSLFRRHRFALLTLGLSVLGASASGVAPSPKSPLPESSFLETAPPAVSPLVLDWVRASVADATPLLASLEVAYASPRIDGLVIDQVVGVFAEVDPRIGELIAHENWRPTSAPPEWLADSQVSATPPTESHPTESQLPAEVRGHIALAAAARLNARGHYEESLAWLTGVQAEDVIAPHLLHYYRAVAQHQLVQLAEAKENAEQLLADPSHAGRRHLELARLIVRDAGGVDPDSLDHLARTMNDIRRRLSLGRSADPEQGLQREVLDALDKLIEQAEKQQQQQQQQASAGGPSAPQQAMEDSRPSEMKGPGEVDPRDVPPGGDWGSLPPDERERVTQQIGRDFPGYYRDLIEAYFQSLATPSDPETPPQQPSQP